MEIAEKNDDISHKKKHILFSIKSRGVDIIKNKNYKSGNRHNIAKSNMNIMNLGKIKPPKSKLIHSH